MYFPISHVGVRSKLLYQLSDKAMCKQYLGSIPTLPKFFQCFVANQCLVRESFGWLVFKIDGQSGRQLLGHSDRHKL